MKTLIVGGTSSLGLILAEELRKKGEVVTAGRTNCDIYVNLCEKIDVNKIPLEIDTMIHTAASFSRDTFEDIEQAVNVNTLGTLKMCEVARSRDIKHMIYVSSIFVTLKKNDPHYSPYSVTKSHGEEIAELYCKNNNIIFTSIRPSQIYGNIKSFDKAHPFLSSIIDAAKLGKDVYLYGTRPAKINLIHINDVSRVLQLVAENKLEGTYDCIHPKDTSYYEFATKMFEAFGQGGEVVFLKDRAEVPDNIFKYSPELYTKLNWEPQISIAEGTSSLVNYRLSKQ